MSTIVFLASTCFFHKFLLSKLTPLVTSENSKIKMFTSVEWLYSKFPLQLHFLNTQNYICCIQSQPYLTAAYCCNTVSMRSGAGHTRQMSRVDNITSSKYHHCHRVLQFMEHVVLHFTIKGTLGSPWNTFNLWFIWFKSDEWLHETDCNISQVKIKSWDYSQILFNLFIIPGAPKKRLLRRLFSFS